MSQRVAKLLARTGLCSRREGEHWVREGRVRLNGVQLASPAANASEADSLEVDGRRVRLAAARQRPRVFVAHKLPGELVTRSDPAGRRTISVWAQHALPMGADAVSGSAHAATASTLARADLTRHQPSSPLDNRV